MSFVTTIRAIALLAVVAGPALAQAPSTAPPSTTPNPRASTPRPQPRPHGTRVNADVDKVRIDDGDTAVIQWSVTDAETVRILGIDTPETRHPGHDLPYAQSFGPEARAFGMGAFAVASKIELLRSPTLDPFRRTLGYIFLNGKNYSTLVVSARLAAESITQFGDNGLPNEAAEVMAAAKAAGPLPFEPPGTFRRRMRDVTQWMKSKGMDPEQ